MERSSTTLKFLIAVAVLLSVGPALAQHVAHQHGEHLGASVMPFDRKRCGGDLLDCWLGGEPGLLPLAAQALHPVFLVGDDLSGKR